MQNLREKLHIAHKGGLQCENLIKTTLTFQMKFKGHFLDRTICHRVEAFKVHRHSDIRWRRKCDNDNGSILFENLRFNDLYFI